MTRRELPDSRLALLLDAHGLSWEQFSKRGRFPAGSEWILAKRSAIVTDLHAAGTSWADMIDITGLSLGSIERLTKAMWNEASRKNVKAVGKRVGSSWKGRSRPGQLERQWAAGTFDFHRGRVRPEFERQKLRDAWTSERKMAENVERKARWESPEYRDRLLAYHRRPDVRADRSEAQTARMLADPVKWTKGRAKRASAGKEPRGTVWTRSSYERRALIILDSDPNVSGYAFEPAFRLPDGRKIVPDFLVALVNGTKTLLEIKASWVLRLPDDHKVVRRLRDAENLAKSNKWNFAVWTEKDRLENVVCD